jgi:hypothetical protein
MVETARVRNGFLLAQNMQLYVHLQSTSKYVLNRYTNEHSLYPHKIVPTGYDCSYYLVSPIQSVCPVAFSFPNNSLPLFTA